MYSHCFTQEQIYHLRLNDKIREMSFRTRLPTGYAFNLSVMYVDCVRYPAVSYSAAVIKTPWLLVRTRNIPTKRPPLVGQVSANFCG
jgi:hypothetical protein